MITKKHIEVSPYKSTRGRDIHRIDETFIDGLCYFISSPSFFDVNTMQMGVSDA